VGYLVDTVYQWDGWGNVEMKGTVLVFQLKQILYHKGHGARKENNKNLSENL
jgi:hypothetical protein